MNRLKLSVLLGLFCLTCQGPILAAETLEKGEPGAVRASSEAFSGVTTLLQQKTESHEIAGAVALVIKDGNVIYKRAVGQSDIAAHQPMTMESTFRIASMSKPISTVAAMMLIEEGKLQLDDPVSKYVPAFENVQVRGKAEGTQGSTAESSGQEKAKTVPAATPVTIRHLLTHTSGIPYTFMLPAEQAAEVQALDVSIGTAETSLSTAENVDRIASIPLVHQPGEAWTYGLNTDVLGRVVEVSSGMRFGEFLRNRIFEPLEMEQTHFFVPAEQASSLATLYTPNESMNGIVPVGPGKHTMAGLTFTSTYQSAAEPRSYESGGAGLVSSAGDYATFLQMLLNGGEWNDTRLLQEETIEQMTKNQIGDLSILFEIHGDKFGYGFGIASERLPTGAPAGTYGWGGVFHTFFWVDPENDLIGIVLTQLYPFAHSTLWADFQTAVYEAVEEGEREASTKAEQAPEPVPQGTHRLPPPGAVYREYVLNNGGNRDWRVTAPDAGADGAKQFLPNPILEIQIDDLDKAIRAEAVLDRWGGHIGTARQRIRVNERHWLNVPEIPMPSGLVPENYYSQDNPVVSIPLDHLHEGMNTIEGTCSALEGHNWGQWGLYSILLRVYYDPLKVSHLSGEIVSPQSGSTIERQPTIRIDSPPNRNDVAKIEVLAWYEGLDEDGDGQYLDWHGGHFQYLRGGNADLREHVGTIFRYPFELTWDTSWVPDQAPESVQLIARIQDTRGVWYVTHPVKDLTLKNGAHPVHLYRAGGVPEKFGVRVGQSKSCHIDLPQDFPVDEIAEAKLALRTWHGWDGHHAPWVLNGTPALIRGKNHLYDFDLLAVDRGAIRAGRNVFTIESDTEHHMLEVLWPGPSLLIRMNRRETAEAADSLSPTPQQP